MEDGQDPKLDEKATSREQHKGKGQAKRNPQIIMMGSIIVLLILVLIFIATPLKGMFLSAKTVPEVTLELVAGPELEESGQYRFEVQAMVSGNPVPDVSFSRDDSLGEAGENQVVVLLNPGESFVLTAVAKNSQGSSEASLELTVAAEIAENGEEDDGVIGSENLGTIEGHIVYPSDHIPDMTIVAEDVDTGHEYETDEIIQDSKYATGNGFKIQVPPGNYHVYAIKPGDDFKAYYDEYMESNYALDSYVKILITIAAGDHVYDVVVGNWWKAPQHEEETADEDKEEKANRPPEITGITIMGTYYTGLAYGISVSATDPDGDPLSYSWTVDDGSIDDPTSSAITWTMPGTAGFYNITVTVEDGKGGQAEKTETVEVLALPTISLDQIPGGGFIVRDSHLTHELNILVGDSNGNKAIRGYLSFDISGLAGKMILSAEMRFNKYHKYGNPFDLIEKIWVESVYWGTGYIQLVDDNLPGVMLGEYDIPTFTCSGKKLVDELKQALSNGHDRFQVRLRHKGYNTNHNDTQDAIQYGGNFPVEFIVTYLP